MARLPPGFKAVASTSLKRLIRVERAGLRDIKRLYDQAEADLERKLKRIAGRAKGEFTPALYQQYLAQIKLSKIQLARTMGGLLGEITKETQVDGLKGMLRDIRKYEKKFAGIATPVPIEEASRFWGVIDKSRSSLLRSSDTSMARYGSRLVGEMEKQLAVSMVQGETAGDAIDRIQRTSDVEWWQGERIVRTENAWAYNATQADAVSDAQSDLPDLMMRWSEHVSDTTWQPLDDRVGDDSVAMHGQVARSGRQFTMPRTASGVHWKMLGKSWAQPAQQTE